MSYHVMVLTHLARGVFPTTIITMSHSNSVRPATVHKQRDCRVQVITMDVTVPLHAPCYLMCAPLFLLVRQSVVTRSLFDPKSGLLRCHRSQNAQYSMFNKSSLAMSGADLYIFDASAMWQLLRDGCNGLSWSRARRGKVLRFENTRTSSPPPFQDAPAFVTPPMCIRAAPM